jgi:O-Antigen ligase
MELSKKSVLKTWLLSASFIVALVAYMPNIIDNDRAYNTFRITNYMLFGSLFFLTFSIKHMVYQRVIFVYSFVLYIFLLETLLFSSLGFNMEFNDILEISIPFIAILIGYNINISTKKYLNFLVIYCIAATMLSVYTAYYYIGSFTILDQSLIDNKNSLGAILSNSGAIILCMIFFKDINKSRKIPFVIFLIIICACLLVLRARAAFVAFLFCFLVFTWLSLRNRKNRYLILGVIIITIGLLCLFGSLTMPTFLNDFFFGTSDSNDLNMLSTGRIDRNIAAIKFISDNPMFGQLTNFHFLEWVHNYLLLKLSQYGLLGSFPLLCLYFYLIWTIIIKISRIREFRMDHFGYMVMIIPIIISLMEPSFPFGPGSVQVIIYFMFGYSLKNSTLIYNKI